jgi:nicotinate phosphoribosyltransferase
MPLDTSALATDLYQLTMLQCYFRANMREEAVFEFFVRRLPRGRNFLVAAGLEQVLAMVQALRFSAEDLEWLAQCGHFRDDFVEHLAGWHFTGDIHAMPEGTVLFADEPILRVTAPLPEAQFVESRIINLLHFQTMIASKAVRSVLAARGKLLVDFGFRRSHGAEAGVMAARAAYLAGLAGTATVAAGREFGIPLFGTMAHSLVQACGDDGTAFRRFAQACPDNVVLLLDTFDTEDGARAVVRMARFAQRNGITINSVRIDSGDLGAHARAVREILDEGGLAHVTIFASGGLDEEKLAELVASGTPIDGFGVGTALDVSADAPYMDCAYKLVEYAGRPTCKRSEGKATWPGRKQVYRTHAADRLICYDVVTIDGDPQSGEPLLRPVMSRGKPIGPTESLADIRRRVANQLECLPAEMRGLGAAEPYNVEISAKLRALAGECDMPPRKSPLP